MNFLQRFFQRLLGKWADNPQDQQYYLKVLFALATAVLCGIAGPAFVGVRGVMFGFLVYATSLYVIVYVLQIEPEVLGGRQKLVTNSLFSFLMLWVLLWTLFYTLTLSAATLTEINILTNVTASP